MKVEVIWQWQETKSRLQQSGFALENFAQEAKILRAAVVPAEVGFWFIASENNFLIEFQFHTFIRFPPATLRCDCGGWWRGVETDRRN